MGLLFRMVIMIVFFICLNRFITDIHEKDYYHENCNGKKDDECSLDPGQCCYKYTHKPHSKTYQVIETDSLSCSHTEIDKAVGKVVFIGAENRNPAFEPDNND